MNVLKSVTVDLDWAARIIMNEDKWCDMARPTAHIGFNTHTCSGSILNLPE
jgi:hypothetical protein